MSDEIIDREILQGIRDIAGDQADELLQELIQNYLEDAPESLRRIKEAIVQRDATQLEESAHALRSISLNLGATKFAQICQSLEFMGRAGHMDDANELLNRLVIAFEDIKSVLKQDFL
jgi:HPt (histidine-containing phosphotransfer) domain-containing protein